MSRLSWISNISANETWTGTDQLRTVNLDGDRQAAQCWATEYIGRILEIDLKGWTDIEKLQFERFAPLLALIKDLSSWSKIDKDDLISTIRAKGTTKEIVYVHKLQKQRRFESALRMIESTVPVPSEKKK